MLSITNKKYKIILNAVDYFTNNKISISKCSKMFKIDRGTLSKYLKEYNLFEDRRHYDIDENFFDNIDSEEKAYWLGFLTADGCIKRNKNQISLGLSIKDYNHLEKLKNSLKSNKKIYIEKYGTNYKKDAVSCYFKFDNKHMYNTLLNIGFSSSKSMNEKPINMNNNLIRHYIRGIFDGDGWLYFNKNSCEIGFGMGLNILLYIKSIFENNINLKEYKIKPYKNIYRYRITSKKEINKILDYLYKDSNIYLHRKYEKYLMYCRFKTKSLKS